MEVHNSRKTGSVQIERESVENKLIEALSSMEKVDYERILEDAGPDDRYPDIDSYEQYVQQAVLYIFSSVTKIEVSKLDVDCQFDEFGVDSLAISRINGELEREFGELPKTVVFEARNIQSLAKIIAERFFEQVYEKYTAAKLSGHADFNQTEKHRSPTVGKENAESLRNVSVDGSDDVAIVGIHGKLPLANNISELWNNLVQGKDCIQEIPADRWNWRDKYSDDKNCIGKTYSRWGGFISGVDKFDPLFFNIPPSDAKYIDPQERLFLEVVWGALEDAGYTASNLDRFRVGVFVGAMYCDYQLFEQNGLRGNASLSSIANRISYHFDFKGPSFAIDSMCSASLTALHLAIQSIQSGECDYAIVGGVNLSIHHEKYLKISYSKFASSDGRCRSFGEGGDGYVPGEGVIATLITRKSLALESNDQIYGLIKASAVNHGGKSVGYTVPNPISQAVVIEHALKKASIDPATIGYIEAHGTGTALGDPIELDGLQRAFRTLSSHKRNWPIGSIKSNIGHLEAASGLAGVAKVLMQIKHGVLVPSIHSETLNGNIDWNTSDFKVQTTLQRWHSMGEPAIHSGTSCPRRACVSSFGAGGSNAHIIIEEYLDQKCEKVETSGPSLIVFSAKNLHDLKQYLNSFIRYLRDSETEIDSPSIEEISYTLQVGRQEMAERIAIVAASKQELVDKLVSCTEDDDRNRSIVTHDGIYRGAARGTGKGQHKPGLHQDSDLNVLAKNWVVGGRVDWKELWQNKKPRKTSLPLYVFNQRSFWLNGYASDAASSASVSSVVAGLAESNPVSPHQFHDRTSPSFIMPVWKPVARTFSESEQKKASKNAIIFNDSSIELAKSIADADGTSLYHLINDADIFEEHAFRMLCEVDNLYILSTIRDDAKADAFNIDEQDRRAFEREHLLPMFHLLKKLFDALPTTQKYRFVLVTNDVHAIGRSRPNIPWGASLIGLLGSSVKEVPDKSAVSVDVSFEEIKDCHQRNKIANKIIQMKDSGLLNAAIRDGNLYYQQNYPISADRKAPESKLVKQGVYAIVGGASGIGLEFAKYLVNRYEARVALIGRRSRNDVEEQISSVRSSGTGEVEYYQADICSLESITKALFFVKDTFGKVNGVVHSALVLKDQTLLRMSEDDFLAAFHPKVNGSLFLSNALRAMSIDFYLIFSSIQSYILNPGQSNYAAGCTFMDALAHMYSNFTGIETKIVNWGYWGNVGAVATQKYKSAMEKQGVFSIETADGMRAIEYLLGSPLAQMSVVNATQETLTRFSVDTQNVVVGSNRSSSRYSYPQKKVNNQLRNELHNVISIWKSKPSYEHVVLSAIMTRLQGIGILISNSYWSFAELIQNLGIVSKYALFFKQLIRYLVDIGYLEEQLGSYRETGHHSAISIEHCIEQLEGLQRDDSHNAIVAEVLKITLPKLIDIITGKLSAVEILFANENVSVFKNIYSKQVIAQFFNRATAQVVSNIVSSVPNADCDKIRIIEVGGGTGATTEEVLRMLDRCGQQSEYTFTDISKDLVNDAKRRFGTSIKSYRVLDIELDPFLQLNDDEGFDVVVATNVLHATKDIAQSLHNAKNLLKPAGKLIVNELVESNLFLTLSVGLLDGWWKYSDKNLRLEGSPLFGVEEWRLQLSIQGFKNIDSFPDSHQNSMLPQCIFIAESDGYCLRNSIAEIASDNAPAVEIECKESSLRQADAAAPERKLWITHAILNEIVQILELSADEIDPDLAFNEYGVDSITAVRIVESINSTFNISLNATDLFNYPTIRSLTEYLQTFKQVQDLADDAIVTCATGTDGIEPELADDNLKGLGPMVSEASDVLAKRVGLEIAIVGVAGRYAKSEDINEFWENLVNGVDCIEDVPKWRWDHDLFFNSERNAENKTYAKSGGFIASADSFDSRFFQISPNDAILMDPQQRLYMEECWKALEDAGMAPGKLYGSKGAVYVGCINGDYVRSIPQFNIASFVGNSPAILASRISYILNLKGPSLAIDSACSSSLVAIELACRALQRGDCDFALAGGVSLMTTPGFYLYSSAAGMLSSTGKCFAFDERADGFVPGEGVGVIVLKRLDDAIRDRDNIYAVIKGVGTNQDGKTSGITAPNAISQADLLKEVYANSLISPDTITYIETHGTGTKLGDPIELQALNAVFNGSHSGKKVPIGSVKTNIGHCLSAAGIASVTKAVLCLKNKVLVPSLNYQNSNPLIDLADKPFYVNVTTKAWEAHEVPRRAAVSSFGFSGTNAHLILEEYSEKNAEKCVQNDEGFQLFVLSAKTELTLKRYAKIFFAYLQSRLEVGQDNEDCFTNLIYTMQVGRDSMEWRLAIAARSCSDLYEKLSEYLASSPCESLLEIVSGRIEKGRALKLGNSRKINSQYNPHNLNEVLELAKLWVSGGDMEWSKLARKENARKISLPTYPFGRERYWYQGDKREGGKNSALDSLKSEPGDGEHFPRSRVFQESIAADSWLVDSHRFGALKVLPAAGFIDLALRASKYFWSKEANQLRNIVFMRPLIVGENSLSVSVELSQKFDAGKDSIPFRVMASWMGADYAFANGMVRQSNSSSRQPSSHVIALLLEKSNRVISSEECYEYFRSVGINYGKEYQVIRKIFVARDFCLSALKTYTNSDLQTKRSLYPAILDAAIQSTVGFCFSPMWSDPAASYMPSSIGSLIIYGDIGDAAHVYVKKADGEDVEFDIFLLNSKGDVLAAIEKLVLTRMHPELGQQHQSKCNLFTFDWIKTGLVSVTDPISVSDSSVAYLYCENKEIKLVNGEYVYVSSDRGDMRNYLSSEERFSGEKVTVVLNLDAISLPKDSQTTEEYYRPIYKEVFDAIKIITEQPRVSHVLFVILFGSQSLVKQVIGFSLAGLLRSIRLEYPSVSASIIELDRPWVHASSDQARWMGELIAAERCLSEGDIQEIRYFQGNRLCRSLIEATAQIEYGPPPFRMGGVYLITGGAGGIGLIFARHLLVRWNARVLMLGRKQLTRDELRVKLAIPFSDEKVEYCSVNVSDRNALAQCLDQINSRHRVNGVIHAAGVNQDELFKTKTFVNFLSVLSPKLAGTLLLDDMTKHWEMDFFVLFSGLASVFGNYGQSDYSAANSFLDFFAEKREELRSVGKRKGKTVSINWPLWKNGGMTPSASIKNIMNKAYGLLPLEDDTGCQVLEYALSANVSSLVVMHGISEKIHERLFKKAHAKTALTSNVPNNMDDNAERIFQFIRSEVAALTGIKESEILVTDSFSDYGLDSVRYAEISNKIADEYELEILPSMFYEVQTVSDLVGYIGRQYHSIDKSALPGESQSVAEEEVVYRSEDGANKYPIESANKVDADIAIIGLSAILPDSRDIDEFWLKVETGHNFIKEVPRERWNWDAFRHGDEMDSADDPCKWGAFIGNVDKFDASFFSISAEEAECMDPQQRLLLQVAWKALENAGVPPKTLATQKSCVFVAIGNTDYVSVTAAAGKTKIRSFNAAGNSHAVAANRLSHFFNLRGKSEPVDTACSSGVVALERAVNELRSGAADIAIVCGANLILAPGLHLAFADAGVLSTKGINRCFDQNADGYTRAEGIIALILTSAHRARVEGYSIRAIIKAIETAHGGRGAALTAPNYMAQKALVKSVVSSAAIDPDSIQYVEAMGTCTTIGDAIEIKALKDAFQELGAGDASSKRCAVSSIKEYVGHMESCAGLLGVISAINVLNKRSPLKLKNMGSINSNIVLEKSRFYFPSDGTPNSDKVIDAINHKPMRASVSAFGFGGVNGYVVLEGAVDGNLASLSEMSDAGSIVVLSAKSKWSLEKSVSNLYSYISDRINSCVEADGGGQVKDRLMNLAEANFGIPRDSFDLATPFVELGIDSFGLEYFFGAVAEAMQLGRDISGITILHNLGDVLVEINSGTPNRKKVGLDVGGDGGFSLTNVCYTLQLGRAHFPHRLAVLCSSLSELVERLKTISQGDSCVGVLYGTQLSDNGYEKQLVLDPLSCSEIDVARHWVSGSEVNWERYYQDLNVRKIELPTYEFEVNSYWIKKKDNTDLVSGVRTRQVANQVDKNNVRDTVLLIARQCFGDVSEISMASSPVECGANSEKITRFVQAINNAFGIKLTVVDIFSCPTMSDIVNIIIEKTAMVGVEKLSGDACTVPCLPSRAVGGPASTIQSANVNDELGSTSYMDAGSDVDGLLDIAVIGIAGRFPGASNVSEFWDNLTQGINSVTEIPKGRWDIDEFYSENIVPEKSNSKWGGFMDDVGCFDSLFFNISPREASLMDPKHRLFLQSAWAALEDAGIRPSSLTGSKTSVFVGCTVEGYGYATENLDASILTGCSLSILPSRLSYFLDLKGPSVAIDTACSSALVSLDLACKSLLSNESTLSVVGGVGVLLSEHFHIVASQARMLSPDGKCKAFDKDANGFVPGECVGVVVIKKLKDALKDGDHIYGVIKASGVNQDGKSAGITAPNMTAQLDLEEQVYRQSGIHPESITYIETHGTGTSIGDPIEFGALKQCFDKFTDKKNYCSLGSVKTNIGHPLTPSGIAGLIKVLLCLKHKKLVPSLHFNVHNPLIEIDDSPFYINTAYGNWEGTNGYPLRAALSSFGFSGTSVHMVLQEAPRCLPNQPMIEIPVPIFIFSAQSKNQLRQQVQNFRSWIVSSSSSEEGDVDLYAICRTLQEGREFFNVRLSVLANNLAELIANIDRFLAEESSTQSIFYKSESVSIADVLGDADTQDLVETMFRAGKFSRIADLWARGVNIDWRCLYDNTVYRKVPLPTYPFKKDDYGIIPPTSKERRLKSGAKQGSARFKLISEESALALKMHSITNYVCVDETDITRQINVLNDLNRISSHILFNALIELDGGNVLAGEFLVDRLIEEMDIPSSMAQFVMGIVHVLASNGIFVMNGEMYRLSSDYMELKNGVNKESIFDELNAWKAEELGPYVSVLTESILYLSTIIKGKKSVLDLQVYQGGEAEINKVFFPTFRQLPQRRMISSCVKSLLNDRDETSSPIRILELKSRPLSTDSILYDCLKNIAGIELTSACESLELCERNKQMFSEKFNISFNVANLSELYLGLGGDSSLYDIAILDDVVHGANDILNSLWNVKSILKRGGAALVIETTKRLEFSYLMFGMMPSWSKQKDKDLRIPYSPMLCNHRILEIFTICGFSVSSLDGVIGLSEYPFSIFLAETNGLVLGEDTAEVMGPKDRTIGAAVRAQNNNQDIDEVRVYLRSVLVDVLKIDADCLRDEAYFEEYGVDSIVATHLLQRFRDDGYEVSVTMFVENRTINSVAAYLHEHLLSARLLATSEQQERVALGQGSELDLRYSYS